MRTGHLPQSVPTIVELLDARAVLGRYHPRTPLYYSSSLSDASGGRVYVKYENHGPVRSFKTRGALYCLSRLSREEQERGVVTASTGNHGQGVAYAGTVLGIRTIVTAPHGTPAIKTDAMRAFGADLRIGGSTLAEAAEYAQEIAEIEGHIYVEDGEDPGLMAGAGSLTWEILEELPEVSMLVVPVGGGNLIAGTSLVAKHLNPDIRIVGVQSSKAPAATRSWEEGRVVEAPCTTFAGGLATEFPGHLAFEVIRGGVDEMHLVSDDDLRRGIFLVLEHCGQIAEGAGAAPFALLEKAGSAWAGETVVLILSGGNLPVTDLESILTEGLVAGPGAQRSI